MSPLPSDALPVRLLKRTLLLSPSPPPPLAAVSRLSFYYPRFVSTCTVTFTACLLWSTHKLVTVMPDIRMLATLTALLAGVSGTAHRMAVWPSLARHGTNERV